jgi:hypothetical protein
VAKRILKLDKIRLDGNTQPRVELDEYLISEYQEAYSREAQMPPLQVMFDGASYWLWDGFHRRWAAERAGLEKLPCFVTEGTQRDAQWASYGANVDHGLRRTNADKAKAVTAALKHPKGVKKSDQKIADHCGVDPVTVAKYRKLLESTLEIPESQSRVGKDGRTLNTENIGKRSIQPEIEVPCVPRDDFNDDEATEKAVDTVVERTIADHLRSVINDALSKWPAESPALVAAILENIATEIRNRPNGST